MKGACNVRTLMDRSGSDRPEKRTALVGKELSRYGIDIAALSETRLEGQVTESGCGYNFVLIGISADQPKTSGVGFTIRSSVLTNSRAFQKASMNDS